MKNTYKVTYIKKVGGNGAFIVTATNKKEALSNAKDLCFTGKDFKVELIKKN